MLHRITWMAVPVIGLVVLGSGLGWWGYNQSQERASLARQVENQYNGSLHQLVSHTLNMENEIGKSLISGDKQSFQRHLRQVWRLSYGAQTDVGRLPFSLMPLHSVQTYLSSVTEDTANWMDSDTDGKTPAVHRKLESYYVQSKKITNSLSQVQSHLLTMDSSWLVALRQSNSANEPRDNQIANGLRAVDSETASYVESLSSVVRPKESKTNSLKDEPMISSEQAKINTIHYFNMNHVTVSSVESPRKNARIPVYVVHGTSPNGPFHAVVTQHGGHVVLFDVEHKVTSEAYDFSDAQDNAITWLKSHGFKYVESLAATQYGGIGYFVYAPVKGNTVVLNQNVAVQVGLDNGQVISFDGHSYLEHPVENIAKRKFSNDALRTKLSSHFQIREQKDAIALDQQGVYQPAVLFYGTGGRETYRIVMNANDGKEMSIEQLTRHG